VAFTVLHVCVGNICRSPMAERLLALALAQQAGPDGITERFVSHGAGTGSWHVGEPMNPPAARQVTARGGDVSGFAARLLSADLIDGSDLILGATAEQVARVLKLRPDAVAKTFVLGEFGRLLGAVDLAGLADAGHDPTVRAIALVAAVDAARRHGDRRSPSRAADDLDDPYGGPDDDFARTADQIEATVIPLAAALTGRPLSRRS
jgi:protein-tyrosine phosphatase